MPPAKITNRYHNPVADFPTEDLAHQAATAINNETKSFKASYTRIDHACWRVEAQGVPLPEFVRILVASEVWMLAYH